MFFLNYSKVKEILTNKLNKEVIAYILVGVATTLVNWIAYFIFKRICSPTVSNIIAWAVSVVFAYIANSRLVFNADVASVANEAKMFVEFVLARLASGVIECVSILVFVEMLMFDDLLIKILTSIFVVAFNYVVSKLWIFRKK